MFRIVTGATLLFAASLTASLTGGCQSPAATDDLDDPVEVTAPHSVGARSGGGRSFVLRRGDDPAFDEVRQYDWRASVAVTSTLTQAAIADDQWDWDMPARITSATVRVQQAAGGIVTPPTGSETEHYEYVSQGSGNQLPEAGASITQTFDVWYWLPNGGKEAVITVSYTFADDEGRSVSKSVDVLVTP